YGVRANGDREGLQTPFAFHLAISALSPSVSHQLAPKCSVNFLSSVSRRSGIQPKILSIKSLNTSIHPRIIAAALSKGLPFGFRKVSSGHSSCKSLKKRWSLPGMEMVNGSFLRFAG